MRTTDWVLTVWVYPGVSYWLDLPRKLPMGGSHKASWSDTHFTSSGSFVQCKGRSALLRASFRCQSTKILVQPPYRRNVFHLWSVIKWTDNFNSQQRTTTEVCSASPCSASCQSNTTSQTLRLYSTKTYKRVFFPPFEKWRIVCNSLIYHCRLFWFTPNEENLSLTLKWINQLHS